jgi:hypothetical protein
MTRPSLRLALLASAVSMLACSAAEAGPAKLRMRGGSGAGAPADLTLTLRPNQAAFADLSVLLADVPDNDITLAVTGAVKARVWPDQEQASGETSTWARRDLRTYLAAIETAGVEGANVGQWVLTYKSGPGETGATVQKQIRFDAEGYGPVIPYTIGSRNRAGFGGWCQVGQLPGSVANKSISAQSSAGAFKFFNGASASDTPSAGTSCLAWNGTYGSTTKSVGAPATGADAYWVDISDSELGLTWRIVWTVNANELNFAPNSSDTANGQQVVVGLFGGGGSTYCGMRAYLESGSYPAGMNIKVTNTVADPLLGTACPDQPWATGWNPLGDPDPDPRWLRLQGRDPLTPTSGAKFGTFGSSSGTINAELTACGCFYYEIANIEGYFNFNKTNKPTPGYEWLMLHHVRAPQMNLNAGKDHSRYLFAYRNDVDGRGLVGVGSIQLAGRDSQVVNNWLRGAEADVLNPTMYDETCGSDRSWIAFNFATHKSMRANNHPDAFQWRFELIGAIDNAPLYNALATDTEVCLAKVVGNTWERGEGYALASGDIGSSGFGGSVVGSGDVGKHVETSHGLFMYAGLRNGITDDDARTALRHRVILVGNSFNDLSFHGIELPLLADHSLIRHNLVSYSYGVTYGLVNGMGYAPLGAFNNGSQTGEPYLNNFVGDVNSTMKVEYNIFAAGAAPNTYDIPSTAISNPAATQTGNDYTDLSNLTTTDAAAAWVDPFHPDQIDTLKDWVAAWTPKAGGRYATSPVQIGPVGDRSRIDHFRATVDPALLVP